MTAAALPSLWLGPEVHEAAAAYHRAREAGLSPLRALVLGNVASFRDGWAFRKTIAAKIGASVRTVGRGLKQGKEFGLVGIARAKKGERPVDAQGNPLRSALPCGWSHRWTIGWGKAGEAVKAAIANARAKFAARTVAKGRALPPAPRGRRLTLEQLNAELERMPRRPVPDDPPPDRPPPS